MNVEDPVERLRWRYRHLNGLELLAAMRREFAGSMAVISSFGAESAVLLDLVAQLDAALPVVFLETGELFDETLEYQRQLTRFLGLKDVRVIRPDPADLARAEDLWRSDLDACCHLRKVLPLERALRGFRALVDGRKRFHGDGREAVQTIEAGEGGIVKISPLAGWSQEQIDGAFHDRALPRHPLVAQGYRSIGCWPCSRPVAADESIRAGRWPGAGKTECGIHRISKQ
jgi:phosphoadenosine phosphosulfate reductase